MWSRVRPKDAFKIRLEVDIVSRKRVQVVIHARLREGRVDQHLGVYGRCAGDNQSSEEGSEGIIAADVVRNRVGDSDVLETTSGDLEVVLWVTQRAKTFNGGVGKDRRMLKVRGIYVCVRTSIRYS